LGHCTALDASSNASSCSKHQELSLLWGREEASHTRPLQFCHKVSLSTADFNKDDIIKNNNYHVTYLDDVTARASKNVEHAILLACSLLPG
jgi:hypothetical protein